MDNNINNSYSAENSVSSIPPLTGSPQGVASNSEINQNIDTISNGNVANQNVSMANSAATNTNVESVNYQKIENLSGNLSNAEVPVNNVNDSIANTTVVEQGNVSGEPIDNKVASNVSVADKKFKDMTREEKDNYVYKSPSKVKYIFMIFFFICLVAVIVFLPEISEFVAIKKAEFNNEVVDTSRGILVCKLSKASGNFTVVYNGKFEYSENQLNKLTYEITTRGDAKLDNDALNKVYNDCEKLSDVVRGINGVALSCDFKNNSVVQNQVFNYEEYDEDEVTAAFTEAGGILPEFSYKEDINKVERYMNANGYTCTR